MTEAASEWYQRCSNGDGQNDMKDLSPKGCCSHLPDPCDFHEGVHAGQQADKRDWTDDVPEWNHPVPASTPENAAKVMAVPGLRAVYHAMNHVASQEEGLCSVANGLATALGCQRKMWTNLARDFPDSEFMRMTVDQSEIGYYMGLQLLSSAFGFFDNGGDLGDPVEGYHDVWPYGETPEEWISRWVEARNRNEAQT